MQPYLYCTQNKQTLNNSNKKQIVSTKNNWQTKPAINHKNFMELNIVKIKIVFDKSQETTKSIQLFIKC